MINLQTRWTNGNNGRHSVSQKQESFNMMIHTLQAATYSYTESHPSSSAKSLPRNILLSQISVPLRQNYILMHNIYSLEVYKG